MDSIPPTKISFAELRSWSKIQDSNPLSCQHKRLESMNHRKTILAKLHSFCYRKIDYIEDFPIITCWCVEKFGSHFLKMSLVFFFQINYIFIKPALRVTKFRKQFKSCRRLREIFFFWKSSTPNWETVIKNSTTSRNHHQMQLWYHRYVAMDKRY